MLSLFRSIRRRRQRERSAIVLAALPTDNGRAGCWPARPRLTRRGIAALSLAGWLLAVVLMSQTSLALLAFCLYSAALVVASVQSLLALRNVSVRLDWPDHVEAGCPFALAVAVSNRRRICTAWNLVFEASLEPVRLDGSDARRRQSCLPGRVEPRLPTPQLQVPVGDVAAGTELIRRIELTLPDRGLYRLGCPNLVTTYPLGIVLVSAQCPQLQPIHVYPRLGRVRDIALQREQPCYVFQEIGSGRRWGLAGDFHGLRQFREGDSARWIHWRTSARLAKLMVREFESRRQPDALIMFDAWLPADAGQEELHRFEQTVSFVASMLVRLAGLRELQLTLALAGARTCSLTGRVSPRLIRAGLQELSVLEATPSPDWNKLLLELPPPKSGTARIRLVTTDRHRHGQILELVQTRRPQWASAFEAAELIVAGSSRFYRLFQIEQATKRDVAVLGERDSRSSAV